MKKSIVSKNNNNDPLSKEQRVALNQLHNAQIVLEVALVILILAFFTINISSAFPGYIIVAVLTIGISGLLILTSGIVITSSTFIKKKGLGMPLETRSHYLRRWLTTIWLCTPITILLMLLAAGSTNAQAAVLYLVLTGVAVLFTLSAIICLLVGIHLTWRRFNKKKRAQVRFISYGAIAFCMLILSILGSYTTTEAIKYSSTSVTDSNLELGQKEVRQIGKDGQKQIKHNLILGIPLSTDTTESVDEIIAKGSRRYQYMYCSNGSYYYYTAEQFKDPNVGYTHQSPDVCAQKGTGTQTTIADVPPAEKIVQQVPTYTSPIYRSPTYTTCTESYFGSSFTCRSY